MLNQFFTNELALGLAQAGAAALMALLLVLLARQQKVHLERESLVALVRGLVQIVAVGSVLGLILEGSPVVAVLVLVGMLVAAALIAARRAKDIPGALRVSLIGIGFGAGLVILVMTWLGVINAEISSLVPVGSMIIANCMNTSALALDRFKSEVASHVHQIEAGLALGAASETVVQPYTRASIQASLIPRIDTLRSLGIVWIPGVMAGMVLAGSDPVYAAIYQFVVIAMIYASSGLTSLVSTFLIRDQIFSSAEQLLLRPKSN